ncbi:MAG: hypothetical protein ABSD64_15125 [Terriglobales bacterium]|jgi:hypothetical protein
MFNIHSYAILVIGLLIFFNTVLESLMTLSGYLLLIAFAFNVVAAVNAFCYIKRLEKEVASLLEILGHYDRGAVSTDRTHAPSGLY